MATLSFHSHLTHVFDHRIRWATIVEELRYVPTPLMLGTQVTTRKWWMKTGQMSVTLRARSWTIIKDGSGYWRSWPASSFRSLYTQTQTDVVRLHCWIAEGGRSHLSTYHHATVTWRNKKGHTRPQTFSSFFFQCSLTVVTYLQITSLRTCHRSCVDK